MTKKLKTTIVVVAIILVLAIALTVYIIIPKKNIDYSLLDAKVTDVPKYSKEELPEGNIIELGEADGNKLTYHRDTNAFIVTNKAGTAFSSGQSLTHFEPIGDPDSDMGKYTLCQVGYTNFNGLEDVFDTTSAEVKIKEKALENGIALDLNFTEYKISFTMEVWLNRGGLKARIVADSIKESGEFGITSITIFPKLGGIKATEDGFIVYPDGSGSLYKLGQSSNKSPISTFCYFENSFDLDQIDEKITQGQYNIMIPAFGITDGKTGTVAYITEGDENSYVTLRPAFSVTMPNSIMASCVYRKSYSFVSPNGVEITDIENEPSAKDFGIQYFFMDNNATEAKITYGDMAQIVRNFMLDAGLLNKKADNNNDIKANLQVVMAAKGNSGMDTSLKVLTKFEDVKKIIEKVNADNRDNLRLYISGWQQGGYGLNPSGDKIAGALGSKSDMKDLNKYLKDSKIESYMVADYVYAINDGIGFNKNSQAVYNEMNLPITNAMYDSYLRNALVELKTFIDKRIPYFEKLGASGVAFEKYGYYLYDDYGAGGKLTRAQTAAAFRKAAKVAAEKKLNVAVQGGNAYMLANVDAIYDMPEKSSEMVEMNYSIPFYQMIVHGSIPYTGNVAGNMAADYVQQKLKWIEYGSQPNFVLTYNSSELLKNTYADDAFATDYESHMETINDCIEEFNTTLAFTAKERMVDHKVLTDDVVCVTYEGGNSIYINYGSEAATIGEVKIPAEAYVVVKGGSAK